jgi:hypothetical protein
MPILPPGKKLVQGTGALGCPVERRSTASVKADN